MSFGILRNPVCLLGFVFVFSPPDDEKISIESHEDEFLGRWFVERLISDGGEITKTRFGYFSRLLVCLRIW